MKPRITSLLFSLAIIAAFAGCDGDASQQMPQTQTPQTQMPHTQIATARFAFVANNSANSVSTFAIDPITGQLRDMGSVAPSGCSGPTYVELHPMMSLLFVTSRIPITSSLSRWTRTAAALP